MEKMEHKLRDPARDVHIVPILQHVSLLDTSKMADANCIAIYDNDEVNFYDGNTVKIEVSEEAVLRGYKCPQTKLWRVPLRPTSSTRQLPPLSSTAQQAWPPWTPDMKSRAPTPSLTR